MKKRLLFAAFALFAFLLCGFTANAAADEKSIADAAGVNDIENDNFKKDELYGEKSVNIYEKTIEIVKNTFADSGKSLLAKALVMLAALIFCGLMSALNFGSEALDRASGYITLLIISAAAYSLLYDVFVFASASMQSLMLALTSLQPVTASLYVMGGNAAAGAASSSAMLLFLTVLDIIATKLILPLLGVCFALALAGAIPGSVDISAISNAVKSTATAVLSFIFTILGFTLYIQTSVAANADSYVTRSVRFASGVFVPVIGSILGDAYRTVEASVAAVRGSVGIAGVAAILAITLPPVIVTALCRLILSLSAAAARSFGCDNEGKLLSNLCGLTGILFALTLGAGAVGIIAMAVFITR